MSDSGTLLERLRWINDNAAGEAFLPDGWRELAELLPDIIAALDAQPVGLDTVTALRTLLAAAEHTHRMDRATAALDAAMADARAALASEPQP